MADELNEEILRLYNSGLSQGQIAKQLGTLTRNAVIGRLYRMRKGGAVMRSGGAVVRSDAKIGGPPAPEKKRLATPRALVTMTVAGKAVDRISVGDVVTTPCLPGMKIIAVYPSLFGVPLEQRTGCAYPVAYEGQHLFCNSDDLKIGADYCAEHYAVCYVPGERRKPNSFVNRSTHKDTRR